MNVPRTKRLLPVVAVVLALYVSVGLAFRLTIKDAVPFVSVFFYATPLPAITFAATFAGFLWVRLRQQRLALFSFAVGLLCASWTLEHSYFTNPDRPYSADRCVVFWNVSSGRLGWPGIVTTLKSQSPDVIGLVEVGDSDSNAMDRWQEAFPDYELTDTQGGMLLLTKGRIIDEAYGSLGRGGRYKHVTIDTDDGLLHVLIVDIDSHPLMSRRWPLEQLATITSMLGEQPIIVMGDFNTPGDSVHFDVLRHTFVNAFESHGSGYAATWPIPLPILQLDHLWANHQVVVSQCRAGWTLRSDHRPITAWVRTSR